MIKPKLFLIEGADKTGKDTVCRHIAKHFKDKCRWINEPLPLTDKGINYNNVMSRHLRRSMHAASAHEIATHINIVPEDVFLLSNRSYFSKQMYTDNDTDSDMLATESHVMHEFLSMYFDIHVIVLLHDDIVDKIDTDTAHCWNTAISSDKINTVNINYRNFVNSDTISLFNIHAFSVKNDYSTSEHNISSIIQIIENFN